MIEMAKKRPKSTEYVRAWRAKNPVRAAYLNLKWNSRRRNIYFDLTLDQFQTFLYDKDYMAKKGTSADSLTLDRKRSSGGYTEGNLQILTKSINCSKGALDELPIDPPF